MKIKSNRIYTEDGCKAGVLTIEDGKFVAFEENGTEADVDYGDLRVIPGIFDTHNHGTCGFNLADREQTKEEMKETVRGYLKGLAMQGTVNVFPTVEYPPNMEAIAEVAEEGFAGAKIMGIHSEGPWLSRVGEKGVRTGWPTVEMSTAEAMVKSSKGLLKLVAIAPEIPGVEEVEKYFLANGVTLAAAHSDNTYKQAKAAYDHRGYSVSTHLGNVMTGLHHRDVGGTGAGLLNDNVDCEVICDGLHISNEMLSIFFKVKSFDKFMMISDCTPLSGAPVGTYTFYGLTVNSTPDGFVLTDTGRLMGSSQPVLFGISNLVENVGLPMETVLKMACLNPAKKYGFDKTKGSIAVGKDADFVVISDDYKAQETFSCGRKIYDRKVDGVIFNAAYAESMRVK